MIEIIKRGERVGDLTVSRGSKGLTISVKVHPSIEELLRSWGTGAIDSVTAYGRHWTSSDGEDMKAYALATETPRTFRSGSDNYVLTHVGQPIMIDEGYLNLSFLRLVGISEGTGIKFSVRGVYSTQELRLIREKISLAIRQFYMDYLLPMDLNVVISSEDVRR